MGVLHPIDAQALTLLCTNLGMWRDARDLIDRDGLLLDTELGSQKTHPAVGNVATCEKVILSLLGELGMTPVARSRITISEKPADVLATFLSKRKGQIQ
jgi:P27 family predicted phage terminase small subunit